MTDPIGDLAELADRVRGVRRALRDMRDADNDLAVAVQAGDRHGVLAALKRSGQARDAMLAGMQAAFPATWEAAARYMNTPGGEA